MTTFFVSRHPGAIERATRQGLAVDRFLAHLDPADVMADDTVIGTLPIHLAAQVCERGARYLHLGLDLPNEMRGNPFFIRACCFFKMLKEVQAKIRTVPKSISFTPVK